MSATLDVLVVLAALLASLLYAGRRLLRRLLRPAIAAAGAAGAGCGSCGDCATPARVHARDDAPAGQGVEVGVPLADVGRRTRPGKSIRP